MGCGQEETDQDGLHWEGLLDMSDSSEISGFDRDSIVFGRGFGRWVDHMLE